MAFVTALLSAPSHGCGIAAFVPSTNLQSGYGNGLCQSTTSEVSEGLQVMESRILSPETTDLGGNPRKVGLALQLDDGTRKSHSMAENSAFVTGFFKGIGTRDAFASLVTSLYFVYDAMEDEFDRTEDELVRFLDVEELRRRGPLELDMEYFHGPDWRDNIRVSPATKIYVDRIREISGDNPHLLIAHQYSRYLGDLFGGQMMGGMATQSLGLDEGKGVAFYEFEGIESTSDFIVDWYRKLNRLDLSDKEKEAIVDEANLVFGLNIGLFEELEGSPLKAMWTVMTKSLKERLNF